MFYLIPANFLSCFCHKWNIFDENTFLVQSLLVIERRSMRCIVAVLLIFILGGVVFSSCKKWQDPSATHPPGLDTMFYCNIPTAVNYNWGFPGTADNSLCFYPTDVFTGSYMMHDSVYQDTLFLLADSFLVSINRLSDTTMSVAGFCKNGNSIIMSADLSYTATVDTMVGDSLTFRGQLLCRMLDTVAGFISKDKFDTTLLHVTFMVASDTGVATHYGSARKQR